MSVIYNYCRNHLKISWNCLKYNILVFFKFGFFLWVYRGGKCYYKSIMFEKKKNLNNMLRKQVLKVRNTLFKLEKSLTELKHRELKDKKLKIKRER